MAKKKPKYYVRPDGLHETIKVINGKRVPFRGRSDAEVDQKMIAYQAKEEKGPLFKEVAEKWKEEHYATISPSTIRGYNAGYKRAVERFGDMPIKQLALNDINALLQKMGKQQFAKKTVSAQRLVINLICRSAILDGIIRFNPCAEAKVPKDLKRTLRTLPSDEELKIVKEGWENPYGLLPYFILYTGCRKGEALAIEYSDIDRKKKIIRVNKSVGFEGQKPFKKTPKTIAGTREIILLDKLAAVLPRGIGLLFPGKSGSYMRQGEYERMWNKWRKAAGVTLTAHQLRHGYATLLFEAGIPERDAMDLMGHREIALTHNIYTHIRKARKEEIATILNEAAKKF